MLFYLIFIGHNISVVAAVAGLNKTAKLEYIVLYSDNYIELTRAPVAVFPDSSVFIAVAEVIVPQQVPIMLLYPCITSYSSTC